jgi:hypothetical protein
VSETYPAAPVAKQYFLAMHGDAGRAAAVREGETRDSGCVEKEGSGDAGFSYFRKNTVAQASYSEPPAGSEDALDPSPVAWVFAIGHYQILHTYLTDFSPTAYF